MTYFYLENLKAKLDVLTPWQVKNAFKEERIEKACETIANGDAFACLDQIQTLGGKIEIKNLSSTYQMVANLLSGIEKDNSDLLTYSNDKPEAELNNQAAEREAEPKAQRKDEFVIH